MRRAILTTSSPDVAGIIPASPPASRINATTQSSAARTSGPCLASALMLGIRSSSRRALRSVVTASRLLHELSTSSRMGAVSEDLSADAAGNFVPRAQVKVPAEGQDEPPALRFDVDDRRSGCRPGPLPSQPYQVSMLIHAL